MINLFVTDIDGCLAEPYAPYDLSGFAALQGTAAHTGSFEHPNEGLPVSICSGRSYPYVEAVTQALGLTTPVLFESGGGRFDPQAAQTTWNPALTDEVEAKLNTVRDWFRTECVPGTSLSLDHAKRTQAGLVSPDPEEIAEVRARTDAFVAQEAPGLRVFETDVSVDVVPPTITKRAGLEWLTDHLGVAMEEVAYIGDSDSDLGALNAVGMSFAPPNATETVRSAVDHVTTEPVLDGTLEAYQYCEAHRRS